MTVFKGENEGKNLSESLRQEVGFCIILHCIWTGWLSFHVLSCPGVLPAGLFRGLVGVMKVKYEPLSGVRLFATPWTIVHQSVEFSRQKYWSGYPFHSPGDLPNPGIEPGSPALQADSLPSKSPGKPVQSREPIIVSLLDSSFFSSRKRTDRLGKAWCSFRKA